MSIYPLLEHGPEQVLTGIHIVFEKQTGGGFKWRI